MQILCWKSTLIYVQWNPTVRQLGSDDEESKQEVIEKLKRLASQFARIVEKLRRNVPVSSYTSVRSNPSSRFTLAMMGAAEIIPSTHHYTIC
jgi:hypothetical protein